jgi:hypothetical protein
MRPILNWLWGFEVVIIGLKINMLNISHAVIFTMAIVNIIALSTIASSSGIEQYYKSIPELKMFNSNIEIVFLSAAILSSLYFLYLSYIGMQKIKSGMNYFEFVGSNESFRHLKFFFYAKFLFLLSYLFSKGRVGIVFIAACCFIASIGFILIGLRGYTVAYLFLFLGIYNLKYKIRILPLVLIAISLLIVSSIVLNFRLGFNVTTTYIEMILAPFHQQGASFEVVFGAVNFRDELISCIGFIEYFQKQDFGSCVDQVRGVYFAEGGGFGSSYFAEIYYLGILPALIISLVFGIALSFLNAAYFRLKTNLTSDKLSGVIVFFLLPNLVYFARSSAFDFVFKACEVLIFVFLILLLKGFLLTHVKNK